MEIPYGDTLNEQGEIDPKRLYEITTRRNIEKAFPAIKQYANPVAFKWNGNNGEVLLNGLPEELSSKIVEFLNK
jgi:hypothetical protein